MHTANPKKEAPLDCVCKAFAELVRIYPILFFDLLFILVQHWWIGSFLLLTTLGVLGVLLCLFSGRKKTVFLSLFFTWYLWRLYSFLVFMLAFFVPEFLVLPLHTVLGTIFHAYNAILLPLFPIHVDVRIFFLFIVLLNLIPFEESNPFLHWIDSVTRTFALATAFLWTVLFSHLRKYMSVRKNIPCPIEPAAALSRSVQLFLSVEFTLFAQMNAVYPILLVQLLSYAYRCAKWFRTRDPVHDTVEMESVKIIRSWTNDDVKLYEDFAHGHPDEQEGRSLLEEHLAIERPPKPLHIRQEERVDPRVQIQEEIIATAEEEEEDIFSPSSSGEEEEEKEEKEGGEGEEEEGEEEEEEENTKDNLLWNT